MTSSLIVRNPDADGDGSRVSHPLEYGTCLHALQDFLGNVQSAFGARTGKHDAKLIAAASKHEVGVAHGLLENMADFEEHLIADEMPKRIVDHLEAVDINHQQRQRCAV